MKMTDTDLIKALPNGVSVEDCTITTVGTLDAEYGIGDAEYDIDIDIAGDAPALLLPGWYADDGNAEVYFAAAEDGRAAAKEYVESGDWGERNKTDWIDVATYRKALGVGEDDDIVEIRIDEQWHTITLEPEEPDCKDGQEHDWRERDVRGHGGGVIITEVCAHCGRYLINNTWAQRSDTGEQGLESVEYREADEASREWVRRNRLVEAKDKLVDSFDTRISGEKLYVRRGELTDDAADWATDKIRELLGEGYDVSWYRDDDDEIIVVVEVE